MASLVLGQHLYPSRHDPVVDNMEVRRLEQGMLLRKEAIRSLAESLPTRRERIARAMARRRRPPETAPHGTRCPGRGSRLRKLVIARRRYGWRVARPA